MTARADASAWVSKAEHDLAAVALIAAASDPPWDIVVFHAQQAVEKLLKALLVSRGHQPPKVHDLTRLLTLCVAEVPDLASFADDCAFLSPLAVLARYPGPNLNLRDRTPNGASQSRSAFEPPFLLAFRPPAKSEFEVPQPIICSPCASNSPALGAEAEEQFQPLIDGSEFARCNLSEDAADATLVDRPEVIDESARGFRETALSSRQGRVECPDACGAGNGHDGDERETLVSVNRRIAHGDARPHAPLLVPNRRVELDEDDGASIDRHRDCFTQPLPSTQRTGVPPAISTSPSSSGRSDVQSPRPSSATSAVSG